MQKETYYQLLAKYLENSLTKTEEEALLVEWQQNPEEKALFDKMNRFRYTDILSPDDIESHLKRVLDAIEPSSDKQIKWLTLSKYAAVAASFLCVVFFAYRFFTKNKKADIVNAKNIYNAKLPQKIELPDKSVVVLGANSSVVWDTLQFGKKVRELYLKGEGYFDVTSNKKVPFIVHTSYGSIKVLGTAFHVKAYTEKNSMFKTVLYRGKIELSLDGESPKTVTLLPNDKINIPIENHKLSHIESVK
ncbi:MAG: hypothetical protein DI598_11125, partial [Pseudopedobacter saltans]